MKQANQKRHRYRNTAFFVVIAASCIGAFLIGIEAIRSIRSNVRSTTVQVIREITNSKSQMLTAILNDTERDLRSLAASLDATMELSSAAVLLERFEKDHTISGLTIIDHGGEGAVRAGECVSVKRDPGGVCRRGGGGRFSNVGSPD